MWLSVILDSLRIERYFCWFFLLSINSILILSLGIWLDVGKFKMFLVVLILDMLLVFLFDELLVFDILKFLDVSVVDTLNSLTLVDFSEEVVEGLFVVVVEQLGWGFIVEAENEKEKSDDAENQSGDTDDDSPGDRVIIVICLSGEFFLMRQDESDQIGNH